jgi:ribosomal protein S18 acetylase RimI-like enzyme
MQYAARRHAARVSAPATESILTLDGVDVGWTIVADLDHEIRLIEIMVLTGYRGRGVGTAAIEALIAAGRGAGKPVRLHVDLLNTRAIALYERLGFHSLARGETQRLMEVRRD